MAISEERESFNKDNTGEQEKAPSPEEEKRDTSLFKGRPSVSRDAAKSWARRDELYRETKIPSSERGKILEKIAQNTGLRREKAKEMYDEIKLRPTKSKERYGLEEGEVKDALDILRESLGIEE